MASGTVRGTSNDSHWEKRYQQKDDNSHKLRTPKIKTFNKINGQRYIFMGALALSLSLDNEHRMRGAHRLSDREEEKCYERFIDNNLHFINFYCDFKSNVV